VHGGGRGVTNVAGWDTSAGSRQRGPGRRHNPRRLRRERIKVTGTSGDGQVESFGRSARASRQAGRTLRIQQAKPSDEKKKGIFGRIIGVFQSRGRGSFAWRL